MSTENDVARSLRSWLREERHEDADRVLDVVFDQIPATPQRRAGWLARRLPLMNNSMLRYGIGAVALALAVVVGFSFLAGRDVGQPIPTATATFMPTPVSFSSFSGDTLPAGPIALDGAFPIRVVFDVPAGWMREDETIGRAALHRTADVAVDFFLVTNIYPDPCRTALGPANPPVGPAVDELATALAGEVGFQAAAPVSTTLGGQPAKALVLTNQIDTSTCDGDPYLQQIAHAGGGEDGGIFGILSGTTERFWIVDVGGSRLVVLVASSGGETEADLAEALGLVDSIHFD
jgi:hypothetical protein